MSAGPPAGFGAISPSRPESGTIEQFPRGPGSACCENHPVDHRLGVVRGHAPGRPQPDRKDMAR